MKTILTFGLFLFSLLVSSVSAGPISSGEVLRIAIKGVPVEEQAQITGEYTVSPSGTVRMPLLKSPIRARGVSPAGLAVKIESAYKSAGIYTTPAINVVSTKIVDRDKIDAQKLVIVGGQAKKPGPIQYIKGMTLFQAVQTAGGPTAFGSMRRVRLIRGATQKEYDLKNNKNKVVKVYPNDTIEIPQKNWRGQ